MRKLLFNIADMLFGVGMCIAGVVKSDWVYLALGVLLINSVINTGGYRS
jgi:hypothetical protein